jgi:hypothetical protein
MATETNLNDAPWLNDETARDDAKLDMDRRTVTDVNGERPLTDYEKRRIQESAEDTAMRRQAAEVQRGTSTIDRQLAMRPRQVREPDPNTIYGFLVPMTVDPQRVTSLLTGESDEAAGYIKDATEFFANTHGVLTRIDAAYRLLMQDKTITPDARSVRLERETSAAFVKSFAARGEAIESLGKKIAFTEGELGKPLEAAAATPRSNELRSVLRSLPESKINEAIVQALNAEQRTPQQTELLNATLGAHALTVGISPERQAGHIRVYNERANPQLLRRLEIMRKALVAVESVQPDALRGYFEGSMRSPFSRASAIRGISEKAQAALDAVLKPVA